MIINQRKVLGFCLFMLFMFYMEIGFPLAVSADDMATLQVRNEVEDQIILSDTLILLKEGDTPLSVLIERFGEKVVCRDRGIFRYIVEIDGLEEGKYGPQSGWIYEINDNQLDTYPGNYKVKPGDKIVWAFVKGY